MPLDPEIAAYLEAQKALPPRSAMTLAQIRARMIESARLNGGPPLSIPRIENLMLPEGVAVRDYRVADSPIVVYFHGGRFISGDLDSHDALCRRLALMAGCRVIAVNYRLAPEHRYPAAIDDALTAVDWALQQSDRVAVAGDSAGGNIAAVVAAARRKEIRRQVLIYPMIDATRSLPSHVEFGEGWGPSSMDMKRGWDEYIRASPIAENAAMNPQISPVFARDLEQLPAALVLTAEYDCLRDEGEQYAHHMGQAGNLVELKRCLGTIHGFITLTGISRLAVNAVEDIGGYLQRWRAEV
jgi:acetyl esterase